MAVSAVDSEKAAGFFCDYASTMVTIHACSHDKKHLHYITTLHVNNVYLLIRQT